MVEGDASNAKKYYYGEKGGGNVNMNGAGEAEKLSFNTVEIGHDVNQSDI